MIRVSQRTFLSLLFGIVGFFLFFGIFVPASYAASDSTTLRLDEGTVQATIQQNGSRLVLDVRSSSSKALACQVRLGDTTTSGLSCQRTFSVSRDDKISIYVQLGRSQGTLRYDTRRERFVAVIDAGDLGENSFPNSSHDAIERLSVTVSTTVLNLYESLDTRVRILDRYGRETYEPVTLDFELQKKNSGSNVWRQAPYNSYVLSRSSYAVTSSDRGSIRILNHLRFRESGNYRLKISARHNNSLVVYQTIVVRDTGSSSTESRDRYDLFLSPRLPNLRQSIDLRIQRKNSSNTTISTSDYITLEIQRRLTPDSGLWTTLRTNNACHLTRNSYRFTSSDAGEVSFSNLVACSSKGFYRIKVTSSSNKDIIGYAYFTILDTRDFVSAPVRGFTTAQRNLVQDEYKGFMDKVNQRNITYPTLSSSVRRYDLWTNYYREINKITYSKPGKLSSYREYQDLKTDFERRMNLYR